MDFDPQTAEAIAARLADLKRKLAARENSGSYKENCVAIRAEIERLESLADRP